MKKLFAAALCFVLALTLFTGCKNKPAESNTSVTDLESVNSRETNNPSETEENTVGETAAQPTPITKEINQTVTDPELGYTITLKKAIIDIPFDDPNIWYNGYRTGVCVEVELKNDSEYSGRFYPTDLNLVVDGTLATRIEYFKNYAAENNLSNLSLDGVQPGESTSGWLFFYFDTNTGYDELIFRYSRNETKITVIGGPDGGANSTLPAKDFDIPI